MEAVRVTGELTLHLIRPLAVHSSKMQSCPNWRYCQPARGIHWGGGRCAGHCCQNWIAETQMQTRAVPIDSESVIVGLPQSSYEPRFLCS